MRLSADEIKHLITLYKQLKNVKDADKIRCVIYWGRGYSWKEIAELLFLSEDTVRSYVGKYQSDGIDELTGTKHKGNNYKLTPEQEVAVVEYVRHHRVLSASKVCAFVYITYGIRFSVNGMTQTLKRLGCRYKKPKLLPAKANRQQQEAWVKDFYTLMDSKSEYHEVFWIDGSGFEHNSNPHYGWYAPGEKAVLKSTSSRRRVNVNGALNCLSDEVSAIVQEKTTTAKTNVELLKKVIRSYKHATEITFILDNARINHARYFTGFVERLNRQGKIAVHLVYLPTYSPNLNVIERLWWHAKGEVLANFYHETFKVFHQAVTELFTGGTHAFKHDFTSLFEWNFRLCD
jgi:transposase